uniref:Uncharacterized protein n=1 Tax=Rhizophora mucronata TaxID=61149 RepID=A0A2P2K8D6_RHIMU
MMHGKKKMYILCMLTAPCVSYNRSIHIEKIRAHFMVCT